MRSALNEFIKRNRIDYLWIGKGPEKGPKSNRAIRTKLEFILTHGLRVVVRPVLSSTVGNWVRKNDPDLPAGIPDFGKQFRKCQTDAVRTALYALHVDKGVAA